MISFPTSSTFASIYIASLFSRVPPPPFVYLYSFDIINREKASLFSRCHENTSISYSRATLKLILGYCCTPYFLLLLVLVLTELEGLIEP
jgi:hypothetical protein